MTVATLRLLVAGSEVASYSTAVSLYVMSPQFSIAPAAKSGMANRSVCGGGQCVWRVCVCVSVVCVGGGSVCVERCVCVSVVCGGGSVCGERCVCVSVVCGGAVCVEGVCGGGSVCVERCVCVSVVCGGGQCVWRGVYV